MLAVAVTGDMVRGRVDGEMKRPLMETGFGIWVTGLVEMGARGWRGLGGAGWGWVVAWVGAGV